MGATLAFAAELCLWAKLGGLRRLFEWIDSFIISLYHLQQFKLERFSSSRDSCV